MSATSEYDFQAALCADIYVFYIWLLILKRLGIR